MCVYNKKDHNGTEALVSHDVLCYTLYTYTFKWHKFWEHKRQLLQPSANVLTSSTSSIRTEHLSPRNPNCCTTSSTTIF